jgi:hypothetical protein
MKWVMVGGGGFVPIPQGRNERTGPMKKTVRIVGLDVHKETIVIAVTDTGQGAATLRSRSTNPSPSSPPM